jgi:hypothetical protein
MTGWRQSVLAAFVDWFVAAIGIAVVITVVAVLTAALWVMDNQ